MSKKVSIIGSGFAGLAAASVLAKAGMEVTIFEKNRQIGGRARSLSEQGYFFDMGPSWYWMPDVFERFFALFDKKPSDFYTLRLLDPGFAIFFGDNDVMDVPASLEGIYALFEKEEEQGAEKLRRFLSEAELKYNLSMNDLVYLPSESILEYFQFNLAKSAAQLHLFKSFHSHASRYFSSPRLLQLMEFPVLFLGGSPHNIPALYSLMNYAALQLGTWYPMGGFSQITEAMAWIATDLGVTVCHEETVNKIVVSRNAVQGLMTSSGNKSCDAVIGASDYHHTESLLDKVYRNYSEKYWDKKTMSPSCLIFYIGVTKKIKKLRHHNLFFDESLEAHTREIYDKPQWPQKPLFYVCCTSKSDPATAPTGHENIFILVPLAVDLSDNEDTRNTYFNMVMKRLERMTGERITEFIDYKKSYCINDFKADYNSYKGNAYGLANTLGQTAFMRPAIRNKKINNLYYCGHLTVPGPGVPPAIISGQIAANELLKKFKN